MTSPLVFIFDLDETLGEMQTAFQFITTLSPYAFFRNQKLARFHKRNQNNSVPLAPLIQQAYAQFIAEIAAREVSSTPLGILRTGILQVFQEFQKMKNEGVPVCCGIYSNNGSLEMLEMTRDLIHSALNTNGLIQELVHYGHPLRKKEIEGVRPGTAGKTWVTMTRFLREGACRIPAVSPTQVLFFDDIDHKDLQKALGENQIQVAPQEFKTPFEEISNLQVSALQNQGLDKNADQLLQIQKACQFVKPGSLESYLAIMERESNEAEPVGATPPQDFKTIDQMLSVIDRLRQSIQPLAVPQSPNQSSSAGNYQGGQRNRKRKQMSRKASAVKKRSRKQKRNGGINYN